MQIPLRWEHWRGVFLWLICTTMFYYILSQQNVQRDPLLLPIFALLNGWGLITIYRLSPQLGDKQSLWLIIGAILFIGCIAIKDPILVFKQLASPLLICTLGLTILTLIIGTHPLGFGPNLWLTFHSFYLQPSELLKISLLLYLARGISSLIVHQSTQHPEDVRSTKGSWFYSPLCMSIVCSLALGLLVLQRDFGALAICGTMIAMLLYLSVGLRKSIWLLLGCLVTLIWINIRNLGIVQYRIEAWLNPWLDPSGKSYQILQSLIAIAHGGILGKGIGLGHPLLIPISFSDFIYSAMIEENGLIGGISIVLLFLLLAIRGIKIAQKNSDPFLTIAATGAACLLAVQSLIIMAGNVRLLPLSGVTLPFLSYGGSSLIVSFLCIGVLFIAQEKKQTEITPPHSLEKRLSHLSYLAVFGYFTILISLLWWGVIRAPQLLTRPDNARKTLNHFFIKRGTIYTRDFMPINSSQLSRYGSTRIYQRRYHHPPLAPIVGYHHYRYGASGVENAMNGILSGDEQNNWGMSTLLQHLAGLPPTGNDVQLTLDSKLQQKADKLLENHAGALVLLNGDNGEILAMSSHPYFNPNLLTSADGTANTPYWTALTWLDEAPFVNRAVQGTYIIPEDQVPIEIRDYFYKPPKGTAAEKRSTQALRLAVLSAFLSRGEKLINPTIVLRVQSNSHWSKTDDEAAFPWDKRSLLFSPIPRETIDHFMQRFPSPTHRWAIWGVAKENNPPITWLMGAALLNQQDHYALAIILEEEDLPLAMQISAALLNSESLKTKP